MNTRIQLSLYVPPPMGAALDAVRRRLDPVQASLIPAHVTLCREDELSKLDSALLRARLATAEARPVTLGFGPAQAFQGHGILLPCVAGEPEFRALRRWLLGSAAIRHQAPHITLAHPRNPRSPDNHIANAAPLPQELSITFDSVCRIQQNGFAPWQIVEEHSLASTERGNL